MARTAFAALLAAGLLISAGCGSKGPKRYPTGGTVTYKSQPVEGAVVSFRSESGVIATGTTDAQGKFKLSTYGHGEGAVPGKHQVTVTKFSAPQVAAGSMSMAEAAKQPTPASAEPRNLLPAKYADPARPALQFDVTPEGPNDFPIQLVD